MAYRSNRAAVQAQIHRATAGGLTAAAQQIVNRVKLGLRGGYLKAGYATGNVLNSVTVTPLDGEGPKPYSRDGAAMGPKELSPVAVPAREGDAMVIRVGTNVLYALLWELGFVPARGVFSPGMGATTLGPIAVRRVEVWATAARDGAADARAAFGRVFARLMPPRPGPLSPPGAPLDMAAD